MRLSVAECRLPEEMDGLIVEVGREHAALVIHHFYFPIHVMALSSRVIVKIVIASRFS
jgi:hypothetical protein